MTFKRESHEGDGSTPSEASAFSVSSEAGLLEIWTQRLKSNGSMGFHQQVKINLFCSRLQSHYCIGCTRNWIPISSESINPIPKGTRMIRWPTDATNRTTIVTQYTDTLEYTPVQPPNSMQNANTQDTFKIPPIPACKMQGCTELRASPYRVQSGRPAGPNFSKSFHIRSNFDSL